MFESKNITKTDLGKTVYEVSLSSFVAAFIDGLGTMTVELAIAAGFDTLGKIKNAKLIDLLKISGLNEVKALALKYGVKEHEEEMNEYIQSDKIKLILPGLLEKTLSGYSFCFTGPLNLFDRKTASEEVRKKGGNVLMTVTNKLSFLVTNDPESGSSKNIAAKDYGIPILNETEFLAILENPDKINGYKNCR